MSLCSLNQIETKATFYYIMMAIKISDNKSVKTILTVNRNANKVVIEH